MSALPKQVQRDLEEVEAMEAAMKAPVDQPSVEQTAVAEPDQPKVVVDAVAAEPSSNVVELKQPEPKVEQKPDAFEQQYKTLRGKYDAEVPRLNAQNKELAQQLQALQAEIEVLKAKPQESKVEPLVTAADEEAFGKDLIELQRRVAKEMLSPLQDEISLLKKENAQLRDLTGKTGSEVASLTFEQRLNLAIPEFNAINADPLWVEWLDTVDPVLRGPRRSVAQAAYANGDIEGVRHYIDLFKAQTAAPVQKPDTRQAELQSQVAPSRSSASVAPATSQERIYTEREADALFNKVGLLNRQGKYEEASKLDAELTAAYQTGRVRG